MKVKMIIILFFATASSLMAVISSTQGSLNVKNQLFYTSDKSQIVLETRSGSIIFKSKSDLLVPNTVKIKSYTKKIASKKQFYSLLKKKAVTTYETENLLYQKGLTEDKIKHNLSRDLKSDPNYINHEVTNIHIPENSEDDIVVNYSLTKKVLYERVQIVTYKDLLNIFITNKNIMLLVDKKFILNENGKLTFCKLLKQNKDMKNLITNENENVDYYSIEKINSFNNDTIFTIAKTPKLPLSISLLNQNDELVKYNLSLIINDNVNKYIDQTKKYPIELKGFNFSKEPISATYKVETKNGVKYLDTSYSIVGKRKNVIYASLKGSTAILEPSKSNDSNLEQQGYLLDIKKYLFQVKKTLKIDGQTNLQWGQSPKQSMVKVKYKDTDGKMSKTQISRGKKQFYDISALWYLISWANKNNIENKSIVFMKRDFPLEAQFIKEDFGYLVKIKNKNRFEFYLDKYNRIVKVKDLAYDMTMKLTGKGFTTKTIRKNRVKLESMFKKYKLIRVN